MTQKHTDQAFRDHAQNPSDGKGARAVPIIIVNDKNEIALIMQDNAPVWRVFGNGFTSQAVQKQSRKGKFHDQAIQILKQETNLPVKLRKQIKPIARFSLIEPETGLKTEENRVFMLNIGKFPLESKKGIFVRFFKPDERPVNMNSNHGVVFDLAAKMMRYNDQKELYTAIGGPKIGKGDRRMAFLDTMLENGGVLTGLAEWKNHPAVAAKRAKGQLQRDP